MHSKKTYTKSIHNKEKRIFSLFFALLLTTTFAQSQTQIEEQDSVQNIVIKEISPKVDPQKRIDGVVAVVGDHVILDSDIDKVYLDKIVLKFQKKKFSEL